MNEYDQTYNPNVLIGHYDLISWFSDFALYLGTPLVNMFAYDKTFDPKVVLGHYDLISWFSDFPLYLGTQLVYEKYFFHDLFAYDKTFDRKVLLGHCDLISWFSDFALHIDTQLVFLRREVFNRSMFGILNKIFNCWWNFTYFSITWVVCLGGAMVGGGITRTVFNIVYILYYTM